MPADNNALRGLIAGRLASLALGLASPPAQGWPPWLRLGVPRVAALIGSGQGASPKEMLQRRQEAGGPALSAMLQERVVGGVHAELAEAVVAPLLSQRRREHWGSFLDLLRLGKPAQAALAEAYGLDLERLLNDR